MPEGFGSRALKTLKSPLPKEVSKYSGLDELTRFQTKIEREQKRVRRSIGLTSGPDFPTPPPLEIASPRPQSVKQTIPERRRKRGFQSTFLTRGGLSRANTRKTVTLGA